MLACLHSASLVGIEAVLVHIEVDVSFGLPGFTVIGLPDATVRESRDRVRAAIRNSGFEFPAHRITVNLAPADVRKAGSSFDLPIALGLLADSGVLAARTAPTTLVLGELSLDGRINPIRGVLPVAIAARRRGLTRLLLPPSNAREAQMVDDLDIRVAESLREAVEALNAPEQARRPALDATPPSGAGTQLDLADIKGQAFARRALEVAAAGGHNLLLVGPPGSGKTMLARRLPGILPPLTREEALDAMMVHSVAGTLPEGCPLSARPFRAPHHTSSSRALVGGGGIPRPGELSLAHHGVLFLDEVLEFPRHVLESLRQPLEDGFITVARAGHATVFPAQVLLVAAMNPCPCGHLGNPRRKCQCTPLDVARYTSRLSGPLRDRIDLIVEMPALPPESLSTAPAGETSAEVRRRVECARARQRARYGETPPGTNARARGRGAQLAHLLNDEARQLLYRAVEQLGLSARGYDRLMRVALTIADLAGADRVDRSHVAESLQYRQ